MKKKYIFADTVEEEAIKKLIFALKKSLLNFSSKETVRNCSYGDRR